MSNQPDTETDEALVQPPVSRLHSRLGPLFVLTGVGLIPWTAHLVNKLPARHVQTEFYDVAWGGFDIGVAGLLIVTGVGLVRRKLWVQSTATAAATMLVCDAWFDVLSSRPGSERRVAVALAVTAEVPSAAVCLLVARNVEEVAERAHRYAVAARHLRLRRRGTVQASA